MTEPNTYELTTIAVPARKGSGGRKSEFAILNDAKIGDGIYVSKERIASCRSFIRSRMTEVPTLVIKTYRVTEGERAGMFAVRREADAVPAEATLATPAA